MANPSDPKKPDVKDVLLGKEPPPERPKKMRQHSMHFTIHGTEFKDTLTPEGAAYLAKLERQKAQHERDEAALGRGPRVPDKAKGQERPFKREADRDTLPKRSKDKDNDLDR